MSGTCATCKHWTPPTERTGFTEALEFEPRSASLKRDADTRYGICGAVVMTLEHPPGQPLPLATVRDGSDYKATMYTRAEFGCAMWKQDTA